MGAGDVVRAQGHGPVFGLSTPTLRKGGWSLDNGFMGQVTEDREMAMFRPMLSYGITQHLQVSASVPVELRASPGMAPARIATRMPATNDVEMTVGWRFQARELGIGSRYGVHTAYLTMDVPTDGSRMGIDASPAVSAALATGYVSRGLYLWVGGLHQRSITPGGGAGDRPGDVTMYSVVLGLRPPALQLDYPHSDWRLFIETVGEVTDRHDRAGVPVPASGGHQLFVGPTVLGLFGGWGVSGGPIFPVYQQLNGARDRDKARLALDLVFWF